MPRSCPQRHSRSSWAMSAPCRPPGWTTARSPRSSCAPRSRSPTARPTPANLKRLGVSDPDDPEAINLFPKDFEAKDRIADRIAEYNKSLPEDAQLAYTDYIGLMISSITTIINAISYILIAFVAVSLVVSSIMIGIITYISVLERPRRSDRSDGG